MAKKPKLPAAEPWRPIDYDEYDVVCIKALSEGHASESQQLHAMQLIIYRLAATYDQSFRPGGLEGQRATDFAEGRRFVGNQLLKFIHIDLPEKRGS